MSISKNFKTDPNVEAVAGIWLDYGPNEFTGKNERIHVLRSGGANKAYEKDLVTAFRPHRAAIKAEVMSLDLGKDLVMKTFVKECVIGWENITDAKGVEIPFSKEAAIELFANLPDLYHDVSEQASKAVLFRAELQKAASGN